MFDSSPGCAKCRVVDRDDPNFATAGHTEECRKPLEQVLEDDVSLADIVRRSFRVEAQSWMSARYTDHMLSRCLRSKRSRSTPRRVQSQQEQHRASASASTASSPIDVPQESYSTPES